MTGLTNGTRYYFRVFAVNAAGTGPASSVANAIPRTAPTAPRSLAAAPTNVSGQIRLTWTAPPSNGGSAITDYVIQRSPNGTSSWTTISDGVSTATAYTVDRTDQRHPLLLPGLRPATSPDNSPASNTANAIPRTKPTAPRSLAAAADRTCPARSA